MPDGSPVAGGISGFDIKLHDGEIWMTNQDLGFGSYGFPNGIIRLTDVDGDGKYNSVGETHIWMDEFVDKARAIDDALELHEGGRGGLGARRELHGDGLLVGGADGHGGAVGALVLTHEENLLADEAAHELAVHARGRGGGVHPAG